MSPRKRCDKSSSTALDDGNVVRAVYAAQNGQPYTAIETLETLLSGNPTLNRARLELAVAYYRTLDRKSVV